MLADCQLRVIQVIKQGNPEGHMSKWQKKVHAREVQHITMTSAEGGVLRFRNSEISSGPIDAKGLVFPHQDTLVISGMVAGCEVHHIPLNGESSTDIIFVDAYTKTRLPMLAVSQASAPLQGLGGGLVKAMDQVWIRVSYGTEQNKREELIMFNVVDIRTTTAQSLGRPR